MSTAQLTAMTLGFLVVSIAGYFINRRLDLHMEIMKSIRDDMDDIRQQAKYAVERSSSNLDLVLDSQARIISHIDQHTNQGT